MQPKSQNEADIRIDIEGLCFRTDAQLEYIQRLTELEPDFSQTEVGFALKETQILMNFVKMRILSGCRARGPGLGECQLPRPGE